MTADILREKFLVFFKAKKHKIIESDSLVPKDDPTVLFTPAGMNQFKKEFMGFDSGFKRAATSQRCLRTDDLEKVGKTSSHHTFFEMLGNFSFGDYFKKEAIPWAWEFLTEELKINQDKLWVSVYQDDDEAYNIWKDKIGIPEKKIVRLGDKDNFWPAEAKTKGPNGPCGPCSEIFFDFGKDIGCGKTNCSPSCNCGRFVEIWNLVFTQFNRKDDASLEPLPNKNIDTGMGLERLAAVMQGKQNNFETELFQPIIQEIKRYAEIKPADENKLLYAISDHLRAVVFSIYDGITPSNEGRGYIVRKIVRKSVLHLRSLGINKPFLNRLVGTLAQIMHTPYPDLKERQEDIAQVILSEEKNFISILDSSEVLLAKIPLNADVEEIGAAVFKLHDTYGFPSEEIEKWLKQQKVKNLAAIAGVVSRKFEEQRQRSKSQSNMKGDVFDVKGLGLKLNATKFIGYKESSGQAEILVILKDGKEVDTVIAGYNFDVILDQTPFYAESGGQIGDTGKLINGNNVFEVTDTQKIDNLILHIGKINFGILKKGDKVVAQINVERRLNIARNHTATHILQAVLREVLGKHVQQQGSLVTAEKFRFDFTHPKGLTKDEIARVEEIANRYINNDYSVGCREMAFKEAKKTGALAFFEEKYGECVRVVAVGNISSELCGGTHLANTGKISLIKMTGESSVASGIRRIEGVTGSSAVKFIQDEQEKAIEESKKINKLKEQKEQGKKRSEEMNRLLPAKALELAGKSEVINGTNAVFSIQNDLDMNSLRLLTDMVKGKLNQAVIALGSASGRRASLVVGLTADLCQKGLSAKNIILQVAPLIGGSGGGRDDFAQAGGTRPENFTLAFDKLRDIIKSHAT